MNRIGFKQFTWFRDIRTPGVIWTDSFLPGSKKGIVSLQNTPYTAQTNVYALCMRQVVPNHLSTAFELSS